MTNIYNIFLINRITKKTHKLVCYLFFSSLIYTIPQLAYSQDAADAIEGIASIFGAFITSSKERAQQKWDEQPELVQLCADSSLKTFQNQSLADLIDNGIGPDHDDLTELVNICTNIASRELSQPISCQVTNSTGENVESMCEEVFAINEAGNLVQLDKRQWVQAIATGSPDTKVVFIEVEAYQIARIEAEEAERERQEVIEFARITRERLEREEEERQRIAEEERIFLASPEGQRQLREQEEERQEALNLARIERERLEQEEEERRLFLASPEGQRQLREQEAETERILELLAANKRESWARHIRNNEVNTQLFLSPVELNGFCAGFLIRGSFIIENEYNYIGPDMVNALLNAGEALLILSLTSGNNPGEPSVFGMEYANDIFHNDIEASLVDSNSDLRRTIQSCVDRIQLFPQTIN